MILSVVQSWQRRACTGNSSEREGKETGGFHFSVGKETQTHLGEQLGFIAQFCLSKVLSQELSLVLGKGMEECGILRTDKN